MQLQEFVYLPLSVSQLIHDHFSLYKGVIMTAIMYTTHFHVLLPC